MAAMVVPEAPVSGRYQVGNGEATLLLFWQARSRLLCPQKNCTEGDTKGGGNPKMHDGGEMSTPMLA